MKFNMQKPAQIISRPKKSGFGEHWGVALPSGHIAHLTPNGEEIVTPQQFAANLPVKIIKQAPHELTPEIMRRAIATTRNPGKYHLVGRNCETYATWLIGEKPHSPQVQGVLVLVVIILVLSLA
jgi:hypothetical protein